MEVVLLNQILKRLVNSMVSLRIVFTKAEHSQVILLNRKAPFMEDIVVSKEGVTKLLKGLNPSKALRPDELYPRVLKELASELGPVFAHLFQQSIDSASSQAKGTKNEVDLVPLACEDVDSGEIPKESIMVFSKHLSPVQKC